MSPQRIQQRRTKGWRKPDGAISVARPGKWGNPYRLVQLTDGTWDVTYPDGTTYLDRGMWRWYSLLNATGHAVARYRRDLYDGLLPYTGDDVVRELAGHDLMCWCSPAMPCHGDVLLRIANGWPNWWIDDAAAWEANGQAGGTP